MKVRKDFVTNSSSSSFVICKNDITKEDVAYIEDTFTHINHDELSWCCQNCYVDDVYYLVDYQPKDQEMHIWVKRDEYMDDERIDDILYEMDKSSTIWPKFDYHY